MGDFVNTLLRYYKKSKTYTKNNGARREILERKRHFKNKAKGYRRKQREVKQKQWTSNEN